jgi:hypothetical protein
MVSSKNLNVLLALLFLVKFVDEGGFKNASIAATMHL